MRIPTWAIYLVPIVPSLLLIFSVWSDLRGFQEKAPFIATHGHIAKLDCQNHGQYQVSFGVGERVLTVGSGNLYLRKTCITQRVGEFVGVWYSEREPNYASFVPPDEALANMNSELTAIICIPYPVWVIFLFVMSKFRNTWLSFRDNKSA
jgi:hypothetical protein